MLLSLLGELLMDEEVAIVAIFVGAGLLAYVVLPGLFIIWDLVLDHVRSS